MFHVKHFICKVIIPTNQPLVNKKFKNPIDKSKHLYYYNACVLKKGEKIWIL